MYSSLQEVNIITNIDNKNYEINLNYIDNKIFINSKLIDTSINLNDYLDKLFNIIKFWNVDEPIGNFKTLVSVVEKDKTYNYYISNNLPNNYDSFIDLLFLIM